ncbi:MAG: SCO family protein [Burkholderiales bacterium]|jgi:protein SCO1/2
MSGDPRRGRRRAVAGLAALSLSGALPRGSLAAATHGRIEPPQPVPEIAMLRDDGVATTLARLLEGRVTAMHFMFTACSSVCPLLGATFGRVHEDLPAGAASRLALLSVSVDALGETPASLQAWRRRMGAGPAWRAAVPRAAEADRLTRWAAGTVPFAFDVHSSQVYVFDPAARLVLRTADLPRPEQISRLLRELAANPLP